MHLIDNPEATPDDLMEFIKGPDFPTRAQILGRVGSRDAYRTGRGSIRMRAVAEIVEGRTNDQIVVTEVPYQTSVDQIARKTAELVERGDIVGLREIRNESAKGKTRLVFELKRDATALVVLNNLFKYTPMQTTFSVNMVALVDGIPRTLNLREALVAYVEHQREVVRRRTEFRLRQGPKKRAHIVEGLLRALDLIDRDHHRHPGQRGPGRGPGAADVGRASSSPRSRPTTSSTCPWHRLTRLARANLEAELAELQAVIAELEAILADEVKLQPGDQGRAECRDTRGVRRGSSSTALVRRSG